MMKVMSTEINIDDQNVVIKAKELLKVMVGEMSDFILYYLVDDVDAGRNFIVNIVATNESFPSDQKVLGILFDHVIIYS